MAQLWLLKEIRQKNPLSPDFSKINLLRLVFTVVFPFLLLRNTSPQRFIFYLKTVLCWRISRGATIYIDLPLLARFSLRVTLHTHITNILNIPTHLYKCVSEGKCCQHEAAGARQPWDVCQRKGLYIQTKELPSVRKFVRQQGRFT